MQHIDLEPFMGRELTDIDWHLLMMQILFKPREKSPSYVESLIQKAHKHSGLNAEPRDPLMDLLGFTPENFPNMGTTFTSEMGNLFETFIKVLFKLTDARIYSTDYTEAFTHLTQGQITDFKKRTGDFIWGMTILEIKFRYGSSEGLTKQKEAAEAIALMGYKPVMLCFRASPNAPECKKLSLWDVYEGEELIEYVFQKTNVNIREKFESAAKHPLIQKRIAELQSLYDESIRAQLEADYVYAIDGHRLNVHLNIKHDDDVRSEFINDIGTHDEVMRGMLDGFLRLGDEAMNCPDLKRLVTETANIINKKFPDQLKKAS